MIVPLAKKNIYADYSPLSEELELIHKPPNFKLLVEPGSLNMRTFLVKVTFKNGQRKYL